MVFGVNHTPSAPRSLQRRPRPRVLLPGPARLLRSSRSSHRWCHLVQGQGSLYEHEVREVFVATGPAPRFVGVVLEAKPDEVVPAIERARLHSTKMYHDALRQRWVGQDGRVLVWHQGRYAKLYCMGYR